MRDDKAYFDEIPEVEIGKEMLDLALHIIDSKMGKFDPASFKDAYQEAVVDLIRAKRAGRPAPAPRAAAPSNVINLMDALRRSLGPDGGKAGKPGAKSAPRRAPRRRRRKRRPRRRRRAKARRRPPRRGRPG